MRNLFCWKYYFQTYHLAKIGFLFVHLRICILGMLACDKLCREDSASALLLLPNKLPENDLHFPSKCPDYQPEVFHNPPNGFQDHSSFTSQSKASFSQCEKKFCKKNFSKESSNGIASQTICTVPDLDVVEVCLLDAEWLCVVR